MTAITISVNFRGVEKPSRGNRIQARIDKLGLNLDEVAERMGTTAATVSRLKNEKRNLTLPWLRRFATVLDCTVEDLISDATDGGIVTVPVVGYVGNAEQLHEFDEIAEIDRTVPPAGAEDTFAVVVRGESLWPKYENGQMLFYKPSTTVLPECVGRICIVQVRNGPALVKRVQRGSTPGRFRLVSLRAPEMEDVDLAWATPILWSKEP